MALYTSSLSFREHGIVSLLGWYAQSQNLIDEESLWFEGSDISRNHFVSARLSRDWVRQELNRPMV
jgi:hypothetical protein